MVQDPEGIHPRILEADLVAEEDLKADAGGGPALRAPHRHDPEARARLDDVENPDIGESGADAPGVHGGALPSFSGEWSRIQKASTRGYLKLTSSPRRISKLMLVEARLSVRRTSTIRKRVPALMTSRILTSGNPAPMLLGSTVSGSAGTVALEAIRGQSLLSFLNLKR